MSIENKTGKKNASSSAKKLQLSIYMVSKFGPEIFTVYTKKTCSNLSVKYESRSVFYKTKTLSSKQYKFLPERIPHDLLLIFASLS